METTVEIDRLAVEKLMAERDYISLAQVHRLMQHDVCYRTLREVVAGERNFRRSTWVALARALDVNPLDIIRVSGPLPRADAFASIVGRDVEIRREP